MAAPRNEKPRNRCVNAGIRATPPFWDGFGDRPDEGSAHWVEPDERGSHGALRVFEYLGQIARRFEFDHTERPDDGVLQQVHLDHGFVSEDREAVLPFDLTARE